MIMRPRRLTLLALMLSIGSFTVPFTAAQTASNLATDLVSTIESIRGTGGNGIKGVSPHRQPILTETVLPMVPIFAPIHPAANLSTVRAAPAHKKTQMATVLQMMLIYALIHRAVRPLTATAARLRKGILKRKLGRSMKTM